MKECYWIFSTFNVTSFIILEKLLKLSYLTIKTFVELSNFFFAYSNFEVRVWVMIMRNTHQNLCLLKTSRFFEKKKIYRVRANRTSNQLLFNAFKLSIVRSRFYPIIVSRNVSLPWLWVMYAGFFHQNFDVIHSLNQIRWTI